MRPKYLQPTEEFGFEDFSDFQNRYTGFGEKIYEEIEHQLPEVFDKLIFYKRQILQQEDSYAEYNNSKNGFVIQLDPLCEVIVLWNENTHIEIGNWTKNEYRQTIHFIKTELLENNEKII